MPELSEMLVFVEGGKPESWEKNPRNKDENQATNSTHLTPSLGIEPHWWEVSAFTTTLSVLRVGDWGLGGRA